MKAYLEVFKALADETRLRIVRVLRSGPFNVNELIGILQLGQSRVSRHLRILADAGLVESRREGSWVYYRLTERWSGEDDAGAAADGVVEVADVDAGGPGTRELGFLSCLSRELELDGDSAGAAGSRRRGWAGDASAVKRCLNARRQNAERFFRDAAPTWDRQRDAVQGPPAYIEPLLHRIGQAGTIVDLGTGTGVLLRHLSGLAKRVIGVDGAPEMLHVAEHNLSGSGVDNVELRLGALEHLPLPDEGADAMVANMVLHHVANPPEALREVRRGLRPGGRFVLADFTAHGEESYREKLGDLWLGFERRDVESWLSDAGFDVEEFREISTGDGRPDVFLLAARAASMSVVPAARSGELRRSDSPA